MLQILVGIRSHWRTQCSNHHSDQWMSSWEKRKLGARSNRLFIIRCISCHGVNLVFDSQLHCCVDKALRFATGANSEAPMAHMSPMLRLVTITQYVEFACRRAVSSVEQSLFEPRGSNS